MHSSLPYTRLFGLIVASLTVQASQHILAPDICAHVSVNLYELVGIPADTIENTPGDLNVCLCQSSVDGSRGFVAMSRTAQLAGNDPDMGVGEDKVINALMSYIASKGSACNYPNNAIPICTEEAPCDFGCSHGFTRIGNTCACPAPYNICAGHCREEVCANSMERAKREQTRAMKEREEAARAQRRKNARGARAKARQASNPRLEKRLPMPQPSKRAPTPQPSRRAPIPQPSKRAPVPQPSKRAPAPQPSKRAPAPQPSKRAPAPQPSKRAPTPQPSKRSPVPQPSKRAPAPQPSKRNPVPQPSKRAPIPVPSKRAPVPQPSKRAPSPQPSKRYIFDFGPSFKDADSPEELDYEDDLDDLTMEDDDDTEYYEEAPIVTRDLIRVLTEDRCRSGQSLCGGWKKGADEWECIDTRTALDSCGGCIYPYYLDEHPRTGTDCSSLPGVVDVECRNSHCFVHSCKDGFVLSPAYDECVSVN